MKYVKPYIVGISGGSASGKTSFLKGLNQVLPNHSTCIVSQDNYYLPIQEQSKDLNNQVNYDLPTSIDREAFYMDMMLLSNGELVEREEYTFNNSSKQAKFITMQPAPLLIMEGLFIFHYSEISDALDLKIYIDSEESIKLKRRLKRDKDERGYPEETVMYQWENHVMPAYLAYLKPYKQYADIIVSNNHSYEKGLEVVSDHLISVLQRKQLEATT